MLSERVRPNCEAAPWVIEEIKRLEQELTEAYAEFRKLSGNVKGVFDRSVWDRAKAAAPTPTTEAQAGVPDTCNPDPRAPHGFCRNASINEDRYVCECEYWEPPTTEAQAVSSEPVAWQHRQRGPNQTEWQEWHTVGYKPQGPESPRFQMRPLYTHSVPKEQAVEPVAWMVETTHKSSGEKQVWISTDRRGWGNMESVTYGEQKPLYTTPPNHREAMQMALEALEAAMSDSDPYINKSIEAITALKQALGDK